MRTLHRPLFEGILHSLHEIFAEGRAADKVLQHQFRSNRKWGGQDRKLVAEGVYDMVRWWRKLLYCCDVTWPRDDVWKATNENLHALVIEAWCGLNEVELGRGVEPRMQDLTRVQSCWNDKSLPRAVRESIPDWMDKWGALELGEQWDKMLPILNSPAPVFLRANRLKTTPQELVEKLKLENIEAETVGDDGVRLKKRSNVFISKSFHSGLFEVQDLHSQPES